MFQNCTPILGTTFLSGQSARRYVISNEAFRNKNRVRKGGRYINCYLIWFFKKINDYGER